MDKLLRGGEGGLSASHFSRLANNPLLPSTPLSSSPQVRILEAFETHGEALFEPEVLEKTDYYRNAHLVIDTLGRYFDARSPEEIQDLARRFIDVYLEKDLSGLAHQEGQSKPGSPPVVRPIKNSDCFEIVDGHHRLAIAHMKGDTAVAVRVWKPGLSIRHRSNPSSTLEPTGFDTPVFPRPGCEAEKRWSQKLRKPANGLSLPCAKGSRDQRPSSNRSEFK